MLTNAHKAKITLMFVLLASCYGLTLFKLYLIQIKHTGFFAAKGLQQYRATITSTPERALIYDRTGTQALALNKESVSAFIVPTKLQDAARLETFLKQQFPAAAERLPSYAHKPFMFIKRHLTEAQKKLIDDAQLPDIQFLKEPRRFYPIESTGPIVGLTDSDNQGIMGVELYCNEQLAGTKTTHVLEQDARSGRFYFRKETAVQGKPGTPVYVTIDSTLQFLAYEVLRETMQQFESLEGSVIIMNPDNGDILAMVSIPAFNPNETEELELAHTKNRVITETYELGSVIKTFLAAAALAEKIVNPETIIDCENKKSMYLDGIRINTWKAHGLLTFSQIIEYSNNVGTTKIALQLGEKLYEHYKRWGFGSKTGIAFPGEQKGFITHPKSWSKQSLASLSYGYELRASILQLAYAFCTIANLGISVKPRLFMSEPIQKTTEPIYDQAVMKELKEMLIKTITQGTAHKAHIAGYTVWGKTGTANLLVDGAYCPDKNIFTFAGGVEKGSYRRVIVTFIKESAKKNIYASSVTVPLFEKIAEKMLIHERVI